jgi:hypothetical protein
VANDDNLKPHWKPGESGNPKGRPKGTVGRPKGSIGLSTQVREIARAYTKEAIITLADIMRNEKAPHTAKVAAAQAILDRGWGKPPQDTTVTMQRKSAHEMSDDELMAIAASVEDSNGVDSWAGAASDDEIDKALASVGPP